MHNRNTLITGALLSVIKFSMVVLLYIKPQMQYLIPLYNLYVCLSIGVQNCTPIDITYSITPYETAGIHVLMEATSKNIPEPDTSMCSEYINHNKYLLRVSVTMLEEYNLFTSHISIGVTRCSMYGR